MVYVQAYRSISVAALLLDDLLTDISRVWIRLSRVDGQLAETQEQLVLICQALGGATDGITSGMDCHRRRNDVGGQSSPPSPAFGDVPVQRAQALSREPSVAPPSMVAMRPGCGKTAEQDDTIIPVVSSSVTATTEPLRIPTQDPEVEKGAGEEGRRPKSVQSDDAVRDTSEIGGADCLPSFTAATAATANNYLRTEPNSHPDGDKAIAESPETFPGLSEGSTVCNGGDAEANLERSGDDSLKRVDKLDEQVVEGTLEAVAQSVSEIEGGVRSSTVAAATAAFPGKSLAPNLPGCEPDAESLRAREYQEETVLEDMAGAAVEEKLLEIGGEISPLPPVAAPDMASTHDSADAGGSPGLALSKTGAETLDEAIVVEGVSRASGEKMREKGYGIPAPLFTPVAVPTVPVPDSDASGKEILGPLDADAGELTGPATETLPSEAFGPVAQATEDPVSPADQHVLKGAEPAGTIPPVVEPERASVETVCESSRSVSLPPTLVGRTIPHGAQKFVRNKAESVEEDVLESSEAGVSERGGASRVAPTTTASTAPAPCLDGDGAVGAEPSKTPQEVIEEAAVKDGRLSDSERSRVAAFTSSKFAHGGIEAATIEGSETRVPNVNVAPPTTESEDAEHVPCSVRLERSPGVEEIKGSNGFTETETNKHKGVGSEHTSRRGTRRHDAPAQDRIVSSANPPLRLRGRKGRISTATEDETEKQAFFRSKGDDSHQTSPATGDPCPAFADSGFITSRLRRPGAGKKNTPSAPRVSKPVSNTGVSVDVETSKDRDKLEAGGEEGRGAGTPPVGFVRAAVGQDVPARRGRTRQAILSSAGAPPSSILRRRRSSDVLFGLRRLSSINTVRQGQQQQQHQQYQQQWQHHRQQTSPDPQQREHNLVRAAAAEATEVGESQGPRSRPQPRSSSPESRGGKLASGAATRSKVALSARAEGGSNPLDSPPSSPEARGGPGGKARRRDEGRNTRNIPSEAENGGGRAAAARGREVRRVQADPPSSSPDSRSDMMEDRAAVLHSSQGGSGGEPRAGKAAVNTVIKVAPGERKAPELSSSSAEPPGGVIATEAVANRGKGQQYHHHHHNDQQGQSHAFLAPMPDGTSDGSQFQADNVTDSGSDGGKSNAGEEMAAAAVRTKSTNPMRGRSSGLLSSMRGAVANSNISKKSTDGRVRSESPPARG